MNIKKIIEIYALNAIPQIHRQYHLLYIHSTQLISISPH